MKALLALLLLPLAWLVRVPGERLRRVWALARLREALPGPIDASLVVLGTPELHGTRRISLGRRLFLYRDLHLETQGEGLIDIGDDVVISRGAHIVAFGRVHIGAGSMIGEYASIRDANHVYDGNAALRHAGHVQRDIDIGANVWIGRGATVLAGVRIGGGAVVGANSVVTRDVAPGAVVVGAPARPIHRAEPGHDGLQGIP